MKPMIPLQLTCNFFVALQAFEGRSPRRNLVALRATGIACETLVGTREGTRRDLPMRRPTQKEKQYYQMRDKPPEF